MRAEDIAIVTFVFATIVALVPSALALIKDHQIATPEGGCVTVGPHCNHKKPRQASRTKRWLWTYIRDHLKVILAVMLMLAWVVPCGIHVSRWIREQPPLASVPSPVEQKEQKNECKSIVVKDDPTCSHLIWRKSSGTCELPKELFVFSTGNHEEDLKAYCAELRSYYGT